MDRKSNVIALPHNIFIWFLHTLSSPFKLQPIKALLIKILEGVRIYLGALDDGILSPNFNPLILAWKCCVTHPKEWFPPCWILKEINPEFSLEGLMLKLSITLHMWISVAPSVGKRSCSWIRCRMLLAVRDTSYFSWASTYCSLFGRHCYNTLSLRSLFQAIWEVWDEELSAYKSSLIVRIIIIMIIIFKLEITYDFLILPLFVFSFFIRMRI